MNLYPFIRGIQGVDVGTQNCESQLRRPNRTARRGRPREAEITAEDERGEGRRNSGRRGFPARIAERFRDCRPRGRDRHGRRTGGERREISSCRSFTSREGDERSKNRMRAPGARALTRALHAGDPLARILRVSLFAARTLPSFLLLALRAVVLRAEYASDSSGDWTPRELATEKTHLRGKNLRLRTTALRGKTIFHTDIGVFRQHFEESNFYTSFSYSLNLAIYKNIFYSRLIRCVHSFGNKFFHSAG